MKKRIAITSTDTFIHSKPEPLGTGKGQVKREQVCIGAMVRRLRINFSLREKGTCIKSEPSTSSNKTTVQTKSVQLGRLLFASIPPQLPATKSKRGGN